MPQPRKHHYLPQFYLRHFSHNGEQIYQIEKQSGRSFQANITNAGAIRDYHRLDHDGTDDQFELEKNLSKIEDVLSNALDRVLADRMLTGETKGGLIQLLSLLRMRVPAVKERIDEHLQQVVRSTGLMLERNGQFPPPPKGFEAALSMENLGIEIKNWAILEYMFQIAFDRDILELLSKMDATIIQAGDRQHFVTSDQPVAMYNPRATSRDAYGVGIVDTDTELSLPLSRKALLLLSWKQSEEGWRTAAAGEVEEFNRRSVIMASDYVFASDIDDSVEGLVRSNADNAAGIQPPEVLDLSQGAIHLMRVKAVMPRENYPPCG